MLYQSAARPADPARHWLLARGDEPGVYVGGFLLPFMVRVPRHHLPVTPRGIHHHTGRTAGQHGRYNCHLLLVHIVHCGARWLNQKNSSAPQLLTSQAKQQAPLGWGHHGPLCVLWSLQKGGSSAHCSLLCTKGNTRNLMTVQIKTHLQFFSSKTISLTTQMLDKYLNWWILSSWERTMNALTPSSWVTKLF